MLQLLSYGEITQASFRSPNFHVQKATYLNIKNHIAWCVSDSKSWIISIRNHAILIKEDQGYSYHRGGGAIAPCTTPTRRLPPVLHQRGKGGDAYICVRQFITTTKNLDRPKGFSYVYKNTLHTLLRWHRMEAVLIKFHWTVFTYHKSIWPRSRAKSLTYSATSISRCNTVHWSCYILSDTSLASGSERTIT